MLQFEHDRSYAVHSICTSVVQRARKADSYFLDVRGLSIAHLTKRSQWRDQVWKIESLLSVEVHFPDLTPAAVPKTQTDELAKKSCDITQIGKATRCAALSTCGQGGVVCCDERGRAKVMPADSCVATGGTVQSGAASPCDVVCPGTSSALSAPDRRQRPRHRARRLPPGATATD